MYGEECKFGGGKTIRDGMGQASSHRPINALDLLISNALIIDHSGIFKADIGVKDGKICGLGKAGNPDIQDGVHDGLIVGSATEVIAGEGLIVTAGAVDAHVHFICPQQLIEGLASGNLLSSFYGVLCYMEVSQGLRHSLVEGQVLQRELVRRHARPRLSISDICWLRLTRCLLTSLSRKGNDSGPEALEDVVKAGAAGLKLHEV